MFFSVISSPKPGRSLHRKFFQQVVYIGHGLVYQVSSPAARECHLTRHITKVQVQSACETPVVISV